MSVCRLSSLARVAVSPDPRVTLASLRSLSLFRMVDTHSLTQGSSEGRMREAPASLLPHPYHLPYTPRLGRCSRVVGGDGNVCGRFPSSRDVFSMSRIGCIL